jgi:hypothetical protein
MAEQEVVQALPGGLCVHSNEFDGRVRRSGIRHSFLICGIWSGRRALLRTYNVFHQRGRVSA